MVAWKRTTCLKLAKDGKEGEICASARDGLKSKQTQTNDLEEKA